VPVLYHENAATLNFCFPFVPVSYCKLSFVRKLRLIRIELGLLGKYSDQLGKNSGSKRKNSGSKRKNSYFRGLGTNENSKRWTKKACKFEASCMGRQ